MFPDRRFALLPGLGLIGSLALSCQAWAVPRLDLSAYPAVASGEQRWVIQLPGVLRPSPDPQLASNPADWRVELLVGRELPIDCNTRGLQGSIREQTLPGWGVPLYRVSSTRVLIASRMACPPEPSQRRGFVTLSSQAPLLPYNASLPIVVDAPRGLQVRWRLWKAERLQQPARPQP